ncbi:MAG: hypothetical protein OXN23_08545 [Gammaproteobacteria bacterium]|nr:hypothetical protein [Gammaproteobacteria bacterium]
MSASPGSRTILLILWASLAAGCTAGVMEAPARALEANPGEAEVDILWREDEMESALAIAREAAEKGFPWAQLRMGMFHELGEGVTQDDAVAVDWYRKAAAQFAERDGMGLAILVGLSDRRGFFRQWDDALAARYFLARHYWKGSGVRYDIVRAWLLADNVRKLSKFKMIEACDTDSRTLYRETSHAQCAITRKEIRDLIRGIEEEMTDEERTAAAEQSESWEYVPSP